MFVATHPGLSVGEYAKLAGVGQTVMTRHLLDLGLQTRRRDPGLGLVEAYIDPLDLRKHPYRLTPKGEALMRRVAARM